MKTLNLTRSTCADASVQLDNSLTLIIDSHNTCSSIAKNHADVLSKHWVSRQTEQQGSCFCNNPQKMSVNTVQLLLGISQIVQAALLIAHGEAVQVFSWAK